MSEEFAKRLIMLRDKLHLSQKEFGKEIGKSRETIVNWEKQKNTPDIISTIKIIKRFKVNSEWLLLGKGEMLFNGDDSFPANQDDLIRKLFHHSDELLMKVITPLMNEDPIKREIIKIEYYTALIHAVNRHSHIFKDIDEKKSMIGGM